MSTANLHVLRPSVGHLDKTPIFSHHPIKNKPLRVGRHKKQTSRTSVQAHEQTHTHALEVQKLTILSDLDLKTFLSNFLSDQLPELDLWIHNQNYIWEIQQKYSPANYKLFVSLLRYFALQHRQKQHLQTTENDFLNAFRLINQRKYNQIKQGVKAHQREKILEIIHSHFPTQYFDGMDICKHYFLTFQRVEAILQLLTLEKILEKTNPSEQSNEEIPFNTKYALKCYLQMI